MDWRKETPNRQAPSQPTKLFTHSFSPSMFSEPGFPLTLSSLTRGEEMQGNLVCNPSWTKPVRPSSIWPQAAGLGLLLRPQLVRPGPAGVRNPPPPLEEKQWGRGRTVPIPLLPQTTTHLSHQAMQRAKDFAENLLGEIRAATPFQTPVTTAGATKLSDSSHDTFTSYPHHHRVVLTNPPPPVFVAGRWRKNTASHLDPAFEDALSRCDW